MGHSDGSPAQLPPHGHMQPDPGPGSHRSRQEEEEEEASNQVKDEGFAELPFVSASSKDPNGSGRRRNMLDDPREAAQEAALTAVMMGYLNDMEAARLVDMYASVAKLD